MRVYFELMRSGNCLMAAISATIGVLIAYNIVIEFNTPFPYISALLISFIVFLITGAGNAINDYFDVDIDRINKPHRPIPSGKITKSTALIFSLLLFLVGTIVAFSLNTVCGLIALFNSLLLVLYALKLKRTVLFGNITIGYLTGSTFLFGGAVFYEYGGVNAVFILFLLATLATIAREIVKDIEDMEGDMLDGAKTLPIAIGAKNSAVIASLIGLFAVFSSPFPYVQSLLNIYYIIFVLCADFIFLYAVIAILKTNNPSKSSKLFKTAMFCALLAFLVGSMNIQVIISKLM